ncbi:MAG: hypothetical protein ACLQD9_02530 [Thermoplasmata archaeon]|nr:hypothetical protein [Thermoplasmata archaeon]
MTRKARWGGSLGRGGRHRRGLGSDDPTWVLELTISVRSTTGRNPERGRKLTRTDWQTG